MDVLSSHFGQGGVSAEEAAEVPVEHLDYSYVEKCSDPSELAKSE